MNGKDVWILLKYHVIINMLIFLVKQRFFLRLTFTFQSASRFIHKTAQEKKHLSYLHVIKNGSKILSPTPTKNRLVSIIAVNFLIEMFDSSFLHLYLEYFQSFLEPFAPVFTIYL